MNRKFIIVVVVLILIWGSFFIYFIKYGNEVRNDPCSVCAKKMGEEVSCTASGILRVYYPDGEIEDIELGGNLKLDKEK